MLGRRVFQPARCFNAVEVTGRDRREPRLGDPAEELRPVEQLEPVSEPAQPDVAREALRQPPFVGSGLVVIRVRRDDRFSGGSR